MKISKEQLTEILKNVTWKEVGKDFDKTIEIVSPDQIEIKEEKKL